MRSNYHIITYVACRQYLKKEKPIHYEYDSAGNIYTIKMTAEANPWNAS